MDNRWMTAVLLAIIILISVGSRSFASCTTNLIQSSTPMTSAMLTDLAQFLVEYETIAVNDASNEVHRRALSEKLTAFKSLVEAEPEVAALIRAHNDEESLEQIIERRAHELLDPYIDKAKGIVREEASQFKHQEVEARGEEVELMVGLAQAEVDRLIKMSAAIVPLLNEVNLRYDELTAQENALVQEQLEIKEQMERLSRASQETRESTPMQPKEDSPIVRRLRKFFKVRPDPLKSLVRNTKAQQKYIDTVTQSMKDHQEATAPLMKRMTELSTIRGNIISELAGRSDKRRRLQAEDDGIQRKLTIARELLNRREETQRMIHEN